MTHENKEEKSVAELLKEVISLTPKEVQAGRLPSLIDRLCSREEYELYLLVKTLVASIQQTGIIKPQGKGELERLFRWKKTRLWYYLQEAVRQKILLYQKRKFSLNQEHPLVQRVWGHYFTANALEHLTNIELVNFVALSLKKQSLEEEVRKAHKSLDHTTTSGSKDDSLKGFIEEVTEILYGDCDIREELISLSMKKVSTLIK